MMIPVSKPGTFTPSQMQSAFRPIMDRAWFTNDGPCVREFEEKVEDFLGLPHFVAVANGTLALEAAISAMFPMGSRVAIPSFTFVAVASALVRCGCRPVFVDIDPETWTMDYDEFASKTNLGGFVVPTVFGVLPDYRFGETQIPGILDNAEGFGKVTHLFCTADVYSFHATKVVSSGEGGGVACEEPLAGHIRRWRNFGFDGSDPAPDMVGTNAKMSEFHAALGLLSLGRYKYQVRERAFLMDVYRDELGERVQFQRGWDPYNCTILVDNKEKVASWLRQFGVDTRPYFYPIHKMPAYQEFVDGPLPVTESVASRSLTLPLWAGLPAETVRKICRQVRMVV